MIEDLGDMSYLGVYSPEAIKQLTETAILMLKELAPLVDEEYIDDTIKVILGLLSGEIFLQAGYQDVFIKELREEQAREKLKIVPKENNVVTLGKPIGT